MAKPTTQTGVTEPQRSQGGASGPCMRMLEPDETEFLRNEPISGSSVWPTPPKETWCRRTAGRLLNRQSRRADCATLSSLSSSPVIGSTAGHYEWDSFCSSLRSALESRTVYGTTRPLRQGAYPGIAAACDPSKADLGIYLWEGTGRLRLRRRSEVVESVLGTGGRTVS